MYIVLSSSGFIFCLFCFSFLVWSLETIGLLEVQPRNVRNSFSLYKGRMHGKIKAIAWFILKVQIITISTNISIPTVTPTQRERERYLSYMV